MDFNGSRSAVAAGYKDSKAVRGQAYDLLTRPDVQARVKELHLERVSQVRLDAATVLRELLMIATCDIGLMFDSTGKLKDIKEIPTEVRRVISGFDFVETFDDDGVKTGSVTKVKTWDKNKAIEQIGRHLKLWTDKLELSGTLTLESLVMGEGKLVEPIERTTKTPNQITAG